MRYSFVIASALLLVLTASSQAFAAGVHGRVIGQDEKGKFAGLVSGAKIEIKNQAGSVVAEKASNQAGYYRVELPPGSYFYKVTAPGYKDEDAGRGFRVERSDGYSIFHFALTTGQTDPDAKPPDLPTVAIGKLSGRVYEQTPEGDVGVPWADFTLRKQGTREVIRVISQYPDTRGNGGGEFAMQLAEGVYEVYVKPPQGFEPKTEKVVVAKGMKPKYFFLTRSVEPSTQPADVTLTLRTVELQRRIARVTAVPVPQVDIAISQGGRFVAKLRSDEDGLGSLQLPAGTYDIVVARQGYVGQPTRVTLATRSVSRQLVLTRATEPQADEPEQATLTLRTVERQRQGNRTATIPVAEVDIAISQGGRFIAKLRSDKDGLSSLQLPPGSYDIVVARQGYVGKPSRVTLASRNIRHELLLTRALGPQPEPPDRPVAELSTVTLRIVERAEKPPTITPQPGSGKPLAGVSVTVIQDGKPIATGKTDNRGYYRLQLAPGKYHFKTNVEDYAPAGIEVVVESRDLTRQVQLTRTPG